jgi:hypothetical protein
MTLPQLFYTLVWQTWEALNLIHVHGVTKKYNFLYAVETTAKEQNTIYKKRDKCKMKEF